MQLQIITPEKVVFDHKVTSVTLPGQDGEFQILEDHAPIVASLKNGSIKINLAKDALKELDSKTTRLYNAQDHSQTFLFDIKSGILEMKDNIIVVLANS